ncbi:GTPase ObgE [Lacticaseibacillus nasuensis]|uniref:GTPase ObgE n=1 Tax=Lacticaseibacillus nasuensis TaxID=944671 RepID=UPI0022450C97|nr:GTPase ObgE [Lacticaseibacillus nasuensis]MCX2454810.1 GTPase ObgE [Lacticaseibacillus nasuensis]
MFVDQVTVEVQAGKGGDGMVAFRREKFVPFGGPAGGDGGHGGSVILYVDEGLRTLMDFRYSRHFKAKPGDNGQPKSMYGRKADNVRLAVPAGTTVYDADTHEELGDLVNPGDELVVAQGGRGGRGNIHFVSPKNTAPEIAENGEPGEHRFITLELKVLADVGLVGFPSVGKSTLLSVVTQAKPKIAAYQFTTLVPNLGMVQLDDGTDFVMADLPGLIEGAHTGVGLGIQFLRHVERTRVILHLVEMDPDNGRDPLTDYHAIRQELASYDETILARPQLVVATKLDLPGAQERFAEFKAALLEEGVSEQDIFAISSITHDGVQPLLQATATALATAPTFALHDTVTPGKYTFTPDNSDLKVSQDEDGTFILSGKKLEKLFKMANLDHDDGVLRFARQLRSLGVDDALREAGAKQGDLVAIDDFTFEFVE